MRVSWVRSLVFGGMANVLPRYITYGRCTRGSVVDGATYFVKGRFRCAIALLRVCDSSRVLKYIFRNGWLLLI